MPYFPLFINIAGKQCVVVGGGKVGSRKTRTLLDFGAAVTVLDPVRSDQMQDLLPQITFWERVYAGQADLAGSILVIAATNYRELNQRIARDAKDLGIPVNVVDDPGLCTFFFPALVRRGELVAGISSSGLCPRFTTLIREQMEELWHPRLGEVLEQLTTERECLKKSVDPEEKIQRLDRFILDVIANLTNKPHT
jgi:siroheme synthase-like protein